MYIYAHIHPKAENEVQKKNISFARASTSTNNSGISLMKLMEEAYIEKALLRQMKGNVNKQGWWWCGSAV